MNDIHLLTGAYVLDALAPAERKDFEEHLSDCPDCAEEVASFAEATTRLALTQSAPPPPELRGRVLSAISTVRPLPPLVPAAVGPDPAGTDAVGTAGVGTAGVGDTTSPAPSTDIGTTGTRTAGTGTAEPGPTPHGRGRFPLRRRLVGVVAAAAVAAGGIGVVVWSPWEDDQPSLTATEQVLEADDAQREVVDLGPAGRAEVIRSVSEDRAVLVTEDMIAPPEGTVYQVWLQTPSDDMLPAAVMEPVPNQTVLLDGPAAEAIGVGITVEPPGGSETPTSPPIALFDLANG